MHFRRAILAAFVMGVLAVEVVGCRERESKSPRLTVFVAASLRDVVEELATAYEADTGTDVSVSAAGTGILRKQIESGARCDVFIAADTVELDKLAEQGLLVADTRCVVARNRLVVLDCGDDAAILGDVRSLAEPAVGRIAMGDPAYVPAGRYARRALEAAGIWEAVAVRAVLADNVRVAGQYVRGGQADVGIVYATDVALMPGCHVVAEIDEKLSGPIQCPGAVPTGAKNPVLARRLLEYFSAPERNKVWVRYGFRPPADHRAP